MGARARGAGAQRGPGVALNWPLGGSPRGPAPVCKVGVAREVTLLVPYLPGCGQVAFLEASFPVTMSHKTLRWHHISATLLGLVGQKAVLQTPNSLRGAHAQGVPRVGTGFPGGQGWGAAEGHGVRENHCLPPGTRTGLRKRTPRRQRTGTEVRPEGPGRGGRWGPARAAGGRGRESTGHLQGSPHTSPSWEEGSRTPGGFAGRAGSPAGWGGAQAWAPPSEGHSSSRSPPLRCLPRQRSLASTEAR